MRRYTVEVNGTEHVIDVEENSANAFRVHLGGEVVDVHLTDHQDLAQALITPHVVPGRASVAPIEPVKVTPRPIVATAAVQRPAPVAGGAPSAGTQTAPMPGVVLSVAVQPGNGVLRGDVLMVIEAMKMKNEIRATRDAQVRAVPVAVGDQVKYGDTLVVFEADA